mmetsp:Transcript_10678/g.30899  ORF Transcript_10678/g.30899 Transcript_10678/m.30899 type:complete len:1881 (+) Transcript_10678:509-6151(+)
MYCLEPPILTAPDGEWHCPVHSGTRRNVNKELSSLTREVDESREKEMGYRPPRVDPSKYQAVVPAILPLEKRAAMRKFDASAPLWLPGRVSVIELIRLLAFSHRLVECSFSSPLLFNEQAMVHLHICEYQTDLAKHMMLEAWRLIEALPALQRDEIRTLGHSDGDLLMAVLYEAHGGTHRPWHIPRGAPTCEVPLPRALQGVQLTRPSGGTPQVSEKEQEWHNARLAGARHWQAEVDGALTGTSISLERVAELVQSGARMLGVDGSVLLVTSSPAADGLPSAALAPAQSVSEDDGSDACDAALFRLVGLAVQERASRRWCQQHTVALNSPQPLDVMRKALAAAETLMLPLNEVESLRSRLAECERWLASASKIQDALCDLREVQDLHRDAEALRLQAPEVTALRNRVAACKRWMVRVHSDLLRRTSSRGRPSTKLTESEAQGLIDEISELRVRVDEVDMVKARLHEASEWKVAVGAALSVTSGIDSNAMTDMSRLLAQGEELNLALDDMAALETRVAANTAWVDKARALLAGSPDAAVLSKAMADGRKLGLALPEMDQMDSLLQESLWAKQAQRALDEPVELAFLERLTEQASKHPAGRSASIGRELKRKLGVGKDWVVKLDEALSGRPSLRDASVMVSEVDSYRILFPQLSELRKAVAIGKAWQEQARRVQAKQTRGASTRATLSDLERILAVGLDLALVVPEVSLLAMQVREASDWAKSADAALLNSASVCGVEITDPASLVPQPSVGSSRCALPTDPRTASSSSEVSGAGVPTSSSVSAALATEIATAASEMDELLMRAEGLTASVPTAAVLRIARWRLRLRELSASSKGEAKLVDFQKLIQEAEELGLRVLPTPAESSTLTTDGLLAAGDKAEATATHDGGEHANGTGVPLRQSLRRSARATSPTLSDTVPVAVARADSSDTSTTWMNLNLTDMRIGAQARKEIDAASRELGVLSRLVSQCEEWEEEANMMLSSERVDVEQLEALLRRGGELPIATETREYLATTFEVAQRWVAQASALLSPGSRLEDLQRLLKDSAKVNLHSDAMEALRERADEGKAWLNELKDLYEDCGIELDNVARVLRSDKQELYCVCRQPDDLRRLMLACDTCEMWYHMHCVGVPNARGRAMDNEEFLCPKCAKLRGQAYKYELRCKKPPHKDTPRAATVAALLRKADRLRVSIEEVDLLRAALASCRKWDARAQPELLAALPPNWAVQRVGGGGHNHEPPLWATVSSALQARLFDEGEVFRVEPEVMTLLKGWKVRRALHAARGLPPWPESASATAGIVKAESQLCGSSNVLLEAPSTTGLLLANETSLECGETKLESNTIGGGIPPARPTAVATSSQLQPPSAALPRTLPGASCMMASQGPGQQPFGLNIVALKTALEDAVEEGVTELEEDGEDPENPTTQTIAPVKADAPEFPSHAGEPWASLYAREMTSIQTDIADARRFVRESQRWVKEAAAFAKSQSALDPQKLIRLIERARSASIKLPAMSALEERAFKLKKWVTATEGALGKAEEAAAQQSAAGAAGVTLDELLQLHAEGLRLRLIGDTWETLVSTLNAICRGLDEVKDSLVHFTDGKRAMEAVIDLMDLGVSLPVDGVLSQTLVVLQEYMADQPRMAGGGAGLAGDGLPAGGCSSLPGTNGTGPHTAHGMQLHSPANLPHLLSGQVPSGTQPCIHEEDSNVQPALRTSSLGEPRMKTGLHGLPASKVSGAPIRVWYDENGSLTSYNGVAEASNPTKGLKVRLIGFGKREWLTDEDEWEWLPGAGDPSGPWPLEKFFGEHLRHGLIKLEKVAEKLRSLAAATEPPSSGKAAGKRTSGAAEGGERKRSRAGEGSRVKGVGVRQRKPAGGQAIARAGSAAETASVEDAGAKRRKR